MSGRSPEERERARLEREQRRNPGAAQTPPPQSAVPQPPVDPPPAPDDFVSAPIGEQPPTPLRGPPPPPIREPEPAPEPEPSFDPVPETPAVPPVWGGLTETHQTFDGFDEFDAPPPPERVSHGRMMLAIGGLAAAVLVIALGWFWLSVFQPFAGDGKGEGEVAVTIPEGAGVSDIGALLAEKGVIASPRNFGWRAGWSGKSEEFKAGRFTFGEGMSYAAAIDLLAKGPNAGTTSVVIPEGRSRWEVDQQVAGLGLTGDYMAATKSSRLINLRRYGAPAGTDSLEGFLFPATYEVPAGANVDKLVPQQVVAFRENIAKVNMSYARKKNLTVYDVVTIASLIDREVSIAKERKLVAAVIYNRLKQGIPLGIDATSRFETRNWIEPLTNAVLQKDTPYNTRINKGLPPGPIGSPGLAAIEAAARPANSAYLYYVANPCEPGAHTFTKTYEEFEAAANRYNQAREKAGGKAPSGC